MKILCARYTDKLTSCAIGYTGRKENTCFDNSAHVTNRLTSAHTMHKAGAVVNGGAENLTQPLMTGTTQTTERMTPNDS